MYAFCTHQLCTMIAKACIGAPYGTVMHFYECVCTDTCSTAFISTHKLILSYTARKEKKEDMIVSKFLCPSLHVHILPESVFRPLTITLCASSHSDANGTLHDLSYVVRNMCILIIPTSECTELALATRNARTRRTRVCAFIVCIACFVT